MAEDQEMNLYRSAQLGDSEYFRTYNDLPSLSRHSHRRTYQNSLIHVLSQFGDYGECVNEIIGKFNVSQKKLLILHPNLKEETALHIAARMGRLNIVNQLLNHVKNVDVDIEEGNIETLQLMVRAIDKNRDTALHMAVRNKNAEVVELLVKEDPSYLYEENNMMETPLYLAVEHGSEDMVSGILRNSTSPAYGGPGYKNALHAAIIKNNEVITKELLKKNISLVKQVDEHGWSPLHYAAHLNLVGRATDLLNADRIAAYITTHDGKTPLHVAVCKGNIGVMEVLLEYCPDCWVMITGTGQNVLHLAVDYEKEKVIKYLVTKPKWIANLINEKDEAGNTPLHLYAKSDLLQSPLLLHRHLRADANAYNLLNSTPLEVQTNLTYVTQWPYITRKHLKEAGGTQGDRNIVQRDTDTYNKWKKTITAKEKEVPVDIRKQGDSQIIVAALIASVSFAAAFTMPGGYNGNDDLSNGIERGTAVFAKEACFRVCICADIIAFMSAVMAIVLYAGSSKYRERRKVVRCHDFSSALLIIATVAMIGAFVSGLYIILEHSTLKLAISSCIAGSITVPVGLALIYYFMSGFEGWK